MDTFQTINRWVVFVGMIAHDHGVVKFAHYALDLYLMDSNHTIGSLAWLLRDLEKPFAYSSRSLFENVELTLLYERCWMENIHVWIHCQNPLVSM